MPTYDYHCDQCRRDFTAMHKIDDPAPGCPTCGGVASKKLSAPAVHGGGARSPASTAAPAATHGCGAGACGCRH